MFDIRYSPKNLITLSPLSTSESASGDLECAIHHSAIVKEYEGIEKSRKKKKEAIQEEREARFCHRVLAAVSLGISNKDILILNFQRAEGKRRKTAAYVVDLT